MNYIDEQRPAGTWTPGSQWCLEKPGSHRGLSLLALRDLSSYTGGQRAWSFLWPLRCHTLCRWQLWRLPSLLERMGPGPRRQLLHKFLQMGPCLEIRCFLLSLPDAISSPWQPPLTVAISHKTATPLGCLGTIIQDVARHAWCACALLHAFL